MMTETVHGITYSKPEVVLLQETGIGTSEVAARTCYDSFDNSENDCIKDIATLGFPGGTNTDLINNIEHSDLLDTLAWAHFHHSILEHANLTYLIKGTSRGVLQEQSRHRIQAISVRSTRYTMSSVINAFVAYRHSNELMAREQFAGMISSMHMFVTTDYDYNDMEADAIWQKLEYQYKVLGSKAFYELAVAKSSLYILDETNDFDVVFNTLQNGKKKRNVGDAFKHIVTDNWKVDLVITFNLRSLKNYFQLRDSGAAFFQIRWLAQAMKEVTPKKYLDLIIKDK